MINNIFKYKTESELQRYIANNFNKLFPFKLKSLEEYIGTQRADIIGEDETTIYIIEIKRFAITREAIKQVEEYLAKYKTKKKLKGILVAPTAHNLDVTKVYGKNKNIQIKLIDNVKCIASDLDKYAQIHRKYVSGGKLIFDFKPEEAEWIKSLNFKGTNADFLRCLLDEYAAENNLPPRPGSQMTN